jgi:HPt (histidine-containing phosphotransfer) domain-containing protein
MQQTPAQAAQLQAAMAKVWQKSLPLLRERVDTLEQALSAVQTDQLTPAIRSNAALEAHRLAGLLGTFGYPDGTDAARMFEIVFDSDAILQPNLAETLSPALVTLRAIVST